MTSPKLDKVALAFFVLAIGGCAYVVITWSGRAVLTSFFEASLWVALVYAFLNGWMKLTPARIALFVRQVFDR